MAKRTSERVESPVLKEETIPLPSVGDLPEEQHVFERETIWAVRAALGAKRPLLVRGEPGVGKTQLARAVAVKLKRPFLSWAVDARTESRDLMWTFDAVQRLADAQAGAFDKLSPKAGRDRLPLENYIRPGPLWWAFDWEDAKEHAGKVGDTEPEFPYDCDPAKGVVVLIDEIDKGESDVPNGLLECLGNGSFQPHGLKKTVACKGVSPLVVVTTNEERVMPDAFVRRCLVLSLELPEGPPDGEGVDRRLVDFLVGRGKAHFPTANGTLLEKAAIQVSRDRITTRKQGLTPLPGQAEYLDLLRAVHEIAKEDESNPVDVIESVANFVLRKHPRQGR